MMNKDIVNSLKDKIVELNYIIETQELIIRDKDDMILSLKTEIYDKNEEIKNLIRGDN